MTSKYWLKPIFIVLAIFGCVILLMNLSTVIPSVDWSDMNTLIISLLPWFVIFGVALSTFVYVTSRR